MDLRNIFFLVCLSLVHLSKCEEEKLKEETVEQDYCQNPETQSQRRLLEITSECSTMKTENDNNCQTLSDCLSENLVKISEDTMIACRKSNLEISNAGGGNVRPCSVAATAYVLLEQIRRLLAEETVYKNCPQVKNLLDAVMKECGGEEGANFLATKQRDLDLNDLAIQEILAKFLVGIGKRMQTFDAVRQDIAELEKSKHMKALGAMIVSFALPGLLGLCEAAHFRTGLVLQTLALFVIGIYQFSRYGGYWAFVGVGSCMLVMFVELGLMILVKKIFYTESGEEEKKTE